MNYKEFKKVAFPLSAGVDQYYQHGLNNGKTEDQLMEYDPEGAWKNFKESWDGWRNIIKGIPQGVDNIANLYDKAIDAGGNANDAIIHYGTRALTAPSRYAYSLVSGTPYSKTEFIPNAIEDFMGVPSMAIQQTLQAPSWGVHKANNYIQRKMTADRDSDPVLQRFNTAGQLIGETAATAGILKGVGPVLNTATNAATWSARGSNSAVNAAKNWVVNTPAVQKVVKPAYNAYKQVMSNPGWWAYRAYSWPKNFIKYGLPSAYWFTDRQRTFNKNLREAEQAAKAPMGGGGYSGSW